MKDQDNRIPKNFQAIEDRLRQIRAKPKSRKNAISHEKKLKSKTGKNDRIQRGIRETIITNDDKVKRGLVYKETINTYAKHTQTANPLSYTEAINFFPKMVNVGIDENDNEIYLPFLLPAWRDINKEKIAPYFYQLALSELEAKSNYEYRLVPFVFNESTALTSAINSQKHKRLDFVRDRLQKSLKAALNRPKDNPVLFWFAFETALRGQPHYQGSLLLRIDELKKARDAFYKLNRQMTAREKQGALRFRGSKRKRQIKKYGRVHAELNWADYNLKERGVTRREYNNLDDIVVATQHLKKHTEDYFNRLRKQFNLLT